MLTTTTRLQFGQAWLRTSVALGRRISVHRIARSGLLFDSQLVPEVSVPGDVALLFLVVRGALRFLEPPLTTHQGPAALLITQAQFEGSATERPTWFVADGEPYCAVDIRVPSDAVLAPWSDALGKPPVSIELPRAVWALAIVLEAAEDDASVDDIAVAMIRALVAARVVSPEVEDAAREPPGARRLWQGLGSFFARSDFMPTLSELASNCGLSERQVSRDLEALLQWLPFTESSWRKVTHRYRLKMAVLGLSSRAPISEVARATGYGSGEAMARAFRDAKLLTPSEIRARLYAHLEDHNR